ncbi:hypothetical protein BU25DRAFT_388275 [Macroventuria anomochaeta]|uniref:Uncharacterized protein n=1 Tax=Macroventuria anomochaeta TaxID=301207 RepID=A0ACB6SAE7_9PLEO|nr:uncharacterized protein BU25DRAFT_388275 [Macroventuria anomochaeta]KAF2630067.1 hypothetical protein BU25DRAFT_388275 [Macroventuria anomochaeta]
MAEQDEVASKVLRRAQVSKMTRTLQNRLALANVKIKNGWESLSLDAIEPVIDVELKRKRPGSSNEAMSDASSVSERFYQPGVLDSSPLAASIFSDDVRRSGTPSVSSDRQHKRPRYDKPISRYPASSNHTRNKVMRSATTASSSWKNNFHLPESSPVYHRRHARFGRTHVPSLSFVSETSTIPDDPRSPLLSEEDDEDLPISSFQISKSHFATSPIRARAPRTPPPDVARSARLRQRGFTAAGAAREGKHGEDDANLLAYLATSPTPVRAGSVKHQMQAPSTPPSKTTPLPSSMMSTPGGSGQSYGGFGLATTPGNNLNFAEFLNMTPSPAQAQFGSSWNRTPVTGKTPAAVREARRRINFDNLVPPTGDGPRLITKVEGLGMDLGGELVS